MYTITVMVMATDIMNLLNNRLCVTFTCHMHGLCPCAYTVIQKEWR